MTIPINSITVGGTALSLADVEYSVSITHGRNDIKSQPEASTAVITILGSSGLDATLTEIVDIQAWSTSRFLGEISDINITHVPSTPAKAITTITAIGNLSNLGSRLTGASGYASQTIYARAETILTDSGTTYLNGGTTALELYSIGAGAAVPQTCLDGLQGLAEWSGATYFDTPEGFVVFESYGQRGITTFNGAWIANKYPWSALSQTWSSFPTNMAATALPSTGVVYTPTWSQNQVSIINDVTVSHGDPASYHQETDANSISVYGRRALTVDTQLKAGTDATTRAADILLAQAYPLWNLGNISIFVDQLSDTDRNAILALVSGSSVLVSGLPTPAPYTQFLGIVEGWSETYTPGQHLLTLSISDPRYSYQTITWAEAGATLQWGQVDPALIWYNAVTADDLAA